VVAEIDAGVKESYADVRELLVHFRTRVGEGDLEHAIRTQLAKFQHQTGIATTFNVAGTGVSLPADHQLQVLHILHEALSNVRKHAGASRVEVGMTRGARYRFTVRDDGRGFELATAPDADGDHVGLRIMRERALRVGGRLVIESQPGNGTFVALDLPVLQPAPPVNAEATAA
jgi:two-component system nitrate/nitrite sensor histidine kinase NarX